MSSFNEEKYKTLLEELECAEVNLSTLNNERRIDPEYFAKRYLIEDSCISKFNNTTIGEIAFVTDGQHGYHEIDINSNIHMLTAKNTKNWFANLDGAEPLAKWVDDNNKRSSLQVDDVILSTRGTVGCCSLVTDEVLPANIDQDVARINIENTVIRPKFMIAYLNSKFGQDWMQRNKTGMVQQGLSLEKVRLLPVPILDDEFQIKIEQIIDLANEKILQAKSLYDEAEKILERALGLDTFTPSTQNISIKTLNESFSLSGRLDAEYYQPKYEDLNKFLTKLNTCQLDEIVNIKKSIEPGSDYYCDEGIPFIRVSDVNKFKISEPEIKLPANVFDDNLYPSKDTILFSKDGSVGLAYKVEEDMKVITSGALLHLSIKDKNILPDYLALVLNSKIVQMQAERDTNGAIIQHWRVEDIKKIIIPIVDVEVQEKISAQIKKSFALRRESERLLESAKAEVERAIEET